MQLEFCDVGAIFTTTQGVILGLTIRTNSS